MKHIWSNSLLDDQPHQPELTSSPTNRLMLAVLEEALVTFQVGLNSRRAQERHHSCEVDRWVTSTDERLLFSFENICSSLKIDPGYVRKGLKRLRVAAHQGRQLRKRLRGLRRERMYDRRAWRGHIGR